MNQPDPHAHLRAAFTAGCRIQAWTLHGGATTSMDGWWRDLPRSDAPQFSCPAHLYRVHPEDEAKALAVWDFRMPTMHQPDGVRFYIERLVCNTDPAGMVRENLLLREEVTRLSTLIAELGQEVGAVAEGEGVEVVVCQLGDYGPVDREMVTILFDDMKIAECYRAEDAEYVAAALREYSPPAHTSEARDSERLRRAEELLRDNGLGWALDALEGE